MIHFDKENMLANFRNRNRNRNDLFAVTGTYRFRKKFFITIIIHAWTVTARGSE